MAREYTREIYLYINGKQINNDIKSIRAEMQMLVNEQAKMIIGSKEYVAHGEKIRSLKGVLNEHTLQLKNMNRTWKETLGAMGDWFNRFQAVGVAAIATIVGVVMAFRKTTEASMLMEERLDNLSALTGLTGRSLEWLGQRAKDLSVSVTETGVRIKQSATDILDAYTKMGSQRPELLKDKEALHEVTQAAIVLSEAGKMQLEPATAALATTMNQFNLEASESGRIINSLAAGSKVGAGEIPYLTEVIEKSGTTASLMGMSIEQMVGTVEAIAPKFAEARRAGTSLDRVLLKMREKGIGVKDGIFDLNRGIDELRIRFAKGESSADLFGVEQAKMGEILVMNQGDINKYTQAVTGTSIAFEQAGINTNNAAGILAQAKNKVQLMYIEIGQKLAPAIIHSTNAWNYFLKAMMAMPEFIQKNKILLVALGGALLAYNGALIKNIALSIASMATKVKDTVVTRSLAASRAIELAMTEAQATQTAALTVVQRMAVVAQVALNTAMKNNPVGWVIMGITALVTALMYFNKNSRANIALEAEKKTLVDDLTKSNAALKETYSEIGSQIGQLNKLSVQEKLDLQEKIKSTIALAEAEIELLESRRGALKAENTKVNFGQFVVSMFNPDKLKEKARRNALKAVAPVDELLNAQKDRLKSLRDQQAELNDILSAEVQGDAIGKSTTTELEAKLERYQVALKNVVIGGADYIRIQKKIMEVEAMLAKSRGASEAGGENKFDRDKALADLTRAHDAELLAIKQRYASGITSKQDYENDLTNEDIRFQMATIERLKKHGQDTLAEETKVQEALITKREECEKEQEELAKKNAKAQEELDKKKGPDLTEEQKKKILEYQYWLETNAEGQKQKLKDDLKANLISQQEYYDKLKAIEKEASERKLEHLERWADVAIGMAEAVTDFNNAQKERELQAAGKDDKKKEAIEKKFAQRQKNLATIQTVIEGAVEIARINSNAGVNADLTQTLRIILTGMAIARTAGNIALIQSQQFAHGKYPVMGADDKQIYQASLLGNIRTGIYNRPTLGLFSEKEPEIVIDGPTTRNIKANFPQIMDAINAARVTQYSAGRYPDLGGSLVSNDEMIGLLKANLRMMQEVRDSHQRPAVVSFQSIRRRQEEFEAIKSKTTLG